MVYAKTKDLPRYKATIISAIQANQGMRAKALSVELERSYNLSVHCKALDKYCRQEKLWNIRPDPITPSRVLKGKRTGAEAMGHGRDGVWLYTAELKAILEADPDAGRRAVVTALSDQHDIHLNDRTVDRWLQKHRTALLDGMLERPIVFETAP